MNPTLITADERHQAPPAGLRAPQFRRMLSYPWAYRRTVILSMVAAVFFAALHTASIGGVLPVLKVILDEEGLHGWIDRTVASARLGVGLRYRSGSDDGGGEVFVDRVSKTHPLFAGGLRAGAVIDTRPGGTADWLERVARAAPGTPIELRVRGGGGGSASVSRALTVAARPIGWIRKAALSAGGLIDRRTAGNKLAMLATVLGALCVVVIAANVFRFLAQYWVSVAVLRGMIAIREQLYARVLRLPMSFFVTSPTSDTVSRFVQDVQEIQRGLLALFGKVVREPLKAAFIFALALKLDWQITLTMLAAAPIAIVIFWSVGRKVKKANRRLLREYGTMIGHLTTTLQSIDVVKAYTSERVEQERMKRIDRKVYHQQLKLAILQALLSPALEVLSVFGVSAVAVWLGGRVLRGGLDASEFLQLSLVMGMLLDPLRKVADVYTRVQRASAGAERVFSIIDMPGEAVGGGDGDGDAAVAPLKDALEFQDVSFRYPGSRVRALNHVSLTIRRGECIAIVGPNGAGKTTLVNMLLRYYDPDEGAVLYDGRDLRELPLAGLRAGIALVTQRAVVFADTVGANIAYGCPGAPPDRIEAAAKQAFADEFIRKRAGAYDAPVGERGDTLSGGERQRIVIARAILRDAPILIFDEATSQVDTDSDEKIHRAIRALARDRTTLMIAHRPSTFRFADRLVLMEAGRIMGSGTHDELLRVSALYRALYQGNGG